MIEKCFIQEKTLPINTSIVLKKTHTKKERKKKNYNMNYSSLRVVFFYPEIPFILLIA